MYRYTYMRVENKLEIYNPCKIRVLKILLSAAFLSILHNFFTYIYMQYTFKYMYRYTYMRVENKLEIYNPCKIRVLKTLLSAAFLSILHNFFTYIYMQYTFKYMYKYKYMRVENKLKILKIRDSAVFSSVLYEYILIYIYTHMHMN
jgi:hypothetical protein